MRGQFRMINKLYIQGYSDPVHFLKAETLSDIEMTVREWLEELKTEVTAEHSEELEKAVLDQLIIELRLQTRE